MSTETSEITPISDQDFPIVIAMMPATPQQRRAALSVAGALLVAALLVAPFAHVQLRRVDAFIPVLQTVLSAADLITSILLFTQYSVYPQRALLAVGSGYLFSGSFAFLQTLSFPGAYAPGGVIGDGYNSPAWFFVLWQTIFPLTIVIYALLKGRAVATSAKSRSATVSVVILIVLSAVAALSLIVTVGVDYLPRFYIGSITLQTRLGNQINAALLFLGAVALVILFVRRRTVLDLWLIVTLIAWMPNFLVAVLASSVRFSMGWYAARGFALIASSTLLCVLLTEMTVLYSRLASAITLQRRESTNRLMSLDAATTAIAHEVRQPLGTIELNVSTALTQVRSNPPDLEDLDVILEEIRDANQRAGAIISSVRELFGRRGGQKATISIADLVQQAIRLLEHDLINSQVPVRIEVPEGLPHVTGDSIQLQQVFLNLIKNALDAMASVPPEKRALVVSGYAEAAAVLLSIRDSGIGIPREDQSRIFEPFFTTKQTGMGLGLAVCRTIIKRHGGDLRLVNSNSTGSMFEVILPAVS